VFQVEHDALRVGSGLNRASYRYGDEAQALAAAQDSPK